MKKFSTNPVLLVICSAVVIVALASIAFALWYPRYLTKRAVEKVRVDMRYLATPIEAFYVDAMRYPPIDKGLKSLVQPEPIGMITGSGISYLPGSSKVLPKDPFTEDGKQDYHYYADIAGWILISPGPDTDYDIQPEQVYRSTIAQPTLTLLVQSYDPTNGLVSDGDIFRVKQ